MPGHRSRYVLAASIAGAMLAVAGCGSRPTASPPRTVSRQVAAGPVACTNAQMPVVERDPQDTASAMSQHGANTVSFAVTFCAAQQPAVMWQRHPGSVVCQTCGWRDVGRGTTSRLGAHRWRSISPIQKISSESAGDRYRAVLTGPGGTVTTVAALLNVYEAPGSDAAAPGVPSASAATTTTTNPSIATGTTGATTSPHASSATDGSRARFPNSGRVHGAATQPGRPLPARKYRRVPVPAPPSAAPSTPSTQEPTTSTSVLPLPVTTTTEPPPPACPPPAPGASGDTATPSAGVPDGGPCVSQPAPGLLQPK